MECSVEGCHRKAKAKGLCGSHYERLRKTGSVGGGDIRPKRSDLADVETIFARAVRGDTTPVDLSVPCLVYPGKGARQGRPYMNDPTGRTRPVPAVAYEHWVGPIPKGHGVLHHCDVPACIEPTHLYTGDQKQNMADKLARGRDRSPRGEASGVARLTEDGVRLIRARCAAGDTMTAIASDLGVAVSTVKAVVDGRTWAHVT